MKNLFLMASCLLGMSAWGAIDVRVGTVAPANTPWSDALEKVKTRVESETKGVLKYKLFLGGQLGGEIEIIQGVRRNRIQMAGLTCAALASVMPELDVLEMPYLFESDAEADYILDTYLFDYFQKKFDEKGLVLLSWAENGWRNIGTKDLLVKAPSDLKGMKVRSQESKTHMEFWKRMGASPVPIAIPEVLPALQTGMVKGFDNTPLFTLAAEWHSAIKYYTVTRHIYQPGAIVYSKKFFDSLTEDQKKIVIGKGNGLAPEYRKGVRALGDQLLAVLRESKVTVHELSSSEQNNFRSALAGLNDSLVGKIGGNAAEVYALIQKGKAEFKKK